MVFFLVLGIVTFVVTVVFLKMRATARVKYIRSYVFPNMLARKVREKYPHLTDAHMAQVARGLRQYFLLYHNANKSFVSMPSQAADELWHEFILHTRSYQYFCKKAFGRFIHHVPAEAMRGRSMVQDGIKRAWRLACVAESINPKQPNRLPFIFALDALLSMPNGFHYSLDCRAENAPGNSHCAGDIGCGGASGSDSSDSDTSGCGGGGCGGGD